MKSWVRNHPEVVKVAAGLALVSLFFTGGLPLWSDDYSQWLAQADSGILTLIKRVLLPFTSDPAAWGYSDRPVQALMYRIYSVIFGTAGFGYFLMKSLAFGILGGTLYYWMRERLEVDRIPALMALGLFAVAGNTVASLVWHSDWSAYSLAIAAFTLVYASGFIEKGPSSTAVYRKGITGVPRNFRNFLILFFALVYFGSKIKGDVRIVPLVLLSWVYLYRRERFKVYAAPFSITFLATLPWSLDLFKKLPPFLGGTPYSGWTYAPFSFRRVLEFLFLDAFNVRGIPLSVAGGMGILVFLGGLTYLVYRGYREKLGRPGKELGLALIWFGFMAVSMGILAGQNPTFQLRYTLLLLAPFTLLVGVFLGSVLTEFSRLPYLRPAVYALVALQCGLNFYHAYAHRRDMGRTQVAIDRAYSTVEEKFPGAQLVLFPGFLNYGYKGNTQAASLQGRKNIGSIDEISQYQTGNTVAISWTATLDPRFSADTFVSGCGNSPFDLIFACGRSDGAFVLRYVGQPQELAQAEALSRQGNTQGARDILEGYVKRDPGNHGVLFSLSLYAYRMKDYARMEEIYDRMGPFHGTTPSVTYNWGLAKQGLQKFREAARYFEAAYSLAPKDYAIGFNLADAYYRQGKKSRALATLGELLQVYPNDPSMKNAQQEWSK